MRARAVLAAVALLPGAARADSEGAALFARCAACHTAGGQGVVGAYPPLGRDLREMAATPEGRRYLVRVVLRGLAGPLEVEGKTYRNVMPAQAGLDAAGVAAVLNHAGGTLASQGPVFRPFSAGEVAALAEGAAAIGPADNARLHASLLAARAPR